MFRNIIFVKYTNFNFALILYGCDSWHLNLMEEYRLRAFEKRLLRRIFGLLNDKL
jgi:hypothetical protein